MSVNSRKSYLLEYESSFKEVYKYLPGEYLYTCQHIQQNNLQQYNPADVNTYDQKCHHTCITTVKSYDKYSHFEIAQNGSTLTWYLI